LKTAWEKSQLYEKAYDDEVWHIPYSEKYWLDFMQIKSVNLPALDAGCGNFGIWRFNKNVVGVDSIDYGNGATNFYHGKAESLPFADMSFSDVYCINSLDHMDDLELAVREMTRVCSDRFIIWTHIFPHKLYNMFYYPHPHVITMKNLRSLIPDTFVVEKFAEINVMKHFSKYSPKLAARIKLEVAGVLGVRAALIHLRRIK